MTFSRKIEFILLVLTFVMSTFLLVGSFESRLANSNGDDHPVVWARYFTHPENWVHDSNFIGSKAFGRASLPNLLAILSTKIHESGPYILSWLYVFIQNVGIGIAFYLFARLQLESKWQAMIVAFLSFSMYPWQLNLAYYPSMMHSPYPGHLVMPFIVLAACFVFRYKMLESCLCLAVAGLIHPSQTIQFIFLILLFLGFYQKKQLNLKTLWPLVIPLITSLAVPLVLVPHFKNPLTDQELLPSALLNPHLVPWNSTTFWPWGFPSMLSAFAISALQCRPFSKQPSKLKAFWWANLTALVVLGAFHVFGAKFKILPLIIFCPFRVSVINSVLLAPIAFIYLIKKVGRNSFAENWTATSIILFLLISKSGFFWGLIFILFLGEVNWKKGGAILAQLPPLFVLLWWLLYLFAGRPLREIFGTDTSAALRLILSPGFSLTLNKIMIVLSASLILSTVSFYLRRKKQHWNCVFGLFAVLFMCFQSYLDGREAFRGELKTNWEMQRWANQSTPKESVFLFESGSWRGVSDRQVQVVGYRKNQILAYFRYREAKEAEQKLQHLYGIYGVKDYSKLPDQGFLTFSKEFKGTHLIERAEVPRRSFKVAYENPHWRIYELPSLN